MNSFIEFPVPIDEGGETEIMIDCSTRELEKYENYDEEEKTFGVYVSGLVSSANETINGVV